MGTVGILVRFGCVGWQCCLCLSSHSLSSTQLGDPDVGCEVPPRVDHVGTHWSTRNAAEPGQPVS